MRTASTIFARAMGADCILLIVSALDLVPAGVASSSSVIEFGQLSDDFGAIASFEPLSEAELGIAFRGQDIVVAGIEAALAARTAPTFLVANEVGLGIVPDNKMARDFRDHAGRLHQRLAQRADRVILMVAGLPLTVK